MRWFLLAGPALFVMAKVTAAQTSPPVTELRAVGSVRDSAGTPIADAEVSIAHARARTDSLGRFSVRISYADSTTITVKRLGYESITFTVATDTLARNDLDVELHAVARSLPAVSVSGSARVPTIEGFEYRRMTKGGLGFFLDRAQIADREGTRLSNILRGARGVRIIRGSGGQNLLRFARWASKGSGCAPQMWLDGALVRGLEVDDIPTSDVEALELYANSSSAPVEFAASSQSNTGGRNACGVVAIWTRRPILKSK
jgi:hypothetical protein